MGVFRGVADGSELLLLRDNREIPRLRLWAIRLLLLLIAVATIPIVAAESPAEALGRLFGYGIIYWASLWLFSQKFESDGSVLKAWDGVIAIGGGIIALYPTFKFASVPLLAQSVVIAIWTVFMLAVLIVCLRKGVRMLKERTSLLPGVMQTRDYAVAAVLSYLYVGFNAGVIFPIENQAVETALPIFGLMYAALLSGIVLLLRLISRELSSDSSPAES